VGDRAGGEDGREERVELAAMAHPRLAGGEAGVVRQLRPLDGGAEAAPEVRAADAGHEPAVRRLERLVGGEGGMGGAEARRLAAVGEPGLRGIGEEGGAGVEHRDLDPAAAAGGVAPAQRGEHGGQAIESGEDVDDRHPHPHRLARREAGERHQPRLGLEDHVVGGAVRLRAGGAVARHRALHEAGIDARAGEARAAETELPPFGGEEVLDQDVRAAEQRGERRAPCRAFEIECHRPLVAVRRDEVGADPGVPFAHPGRPPGAGLVAAVRLLDLDHVGSEVAQQHGEIGTGEDPRGVDHPHPGERALSLRRLPAGRARHGGKRS
jgi:hypothetical protein